MPRYTKARGIVKGAPSGFAISLMIHAAAFMLAGMLVVFNVVKKEEKKFIPPTPVERPKMKLKKPKVKVKKTTKPRSTQRIVTKVKRASMPDIQLPEMSGIGEGLVGGVGGFEMMPDLGEVTLFGGGQTIGNDFVGTFYDLKRGRSGRPLPLMERENTQNLVYKFLRSGWSPSVLAQYYRSPRKLYTTTFMVPATISKLAPEAFGEGDTLGYNWLAHYKGQLVHYEDIRFRFWGRGDDVLTVRVDNEIVLEGSWGGTSETLSPVWPRTRADSDKYPLGFGRAIVGDWIDLKAGVPRDMEVVIGEIPGGVFQSMLCVEVEGVEYERNPVMGGPILPIFKTEELSPDLHDVIAYHLTSTEVDLDSGPVFRDYAPRETEAAVEPAVEPESSVPVRKDSGIRLWNTTNGKSFEAEFVSNVGGKLTMKDVKGKSVRMNLSDLSESDRRFISMATPPKFEIKFLKPSRQVPAPAESPLIVNQKPYTGEDMTFGARVEMQGSKPYPFNVTVECFVVGVEADGNTYKVIDHLDSNYMPDGINAGKHEFMGETRRLERYALNDNLDMRGVSYNGYLILIYDETGKIIAYKTSHQRLYDNLEKLKNIPVGKWMDKNCERVGPPRARYGKHRPDWQS